MYNCLSHLEQISKELRVSNKTAIVYNGKSLSYEQLYCKSKQFGLSLLNYGIKPQEHINLSLPDSMEFIIGFLGCLYVGVIPVLDIRNVSHECFIDIDEFIRKNYNSSVFPPNTNENDDAFILCTSGTTGQTKLVVHKQKSIVGTGLQFGPYLEITQSDVMMSASKMTHAYGLGNSLSIPLSHGCTIVLEDGLPTPEKVFDHIEKNKVTIFCGVPRHFTSLLSVTKEHNLKSLKICLSAGESLPKIVKESFTKRFDCSIIDSIGSTEMLGFCLTSGYPVDGCQVKLLNDYEEEVEDGDIGELYVKSPLASTHYYNDDRASKYTFRDGWIKTNDMCVKKNGVIYHKGRKNDCIKINGLYVSLNSLEKELYTIQSVFEAAVIASENKYGLNRIEIFVVLKDHFNKKEEYSKILKLFKSHNLMFKKPYTIRIVDYLPRTPSGKIHKYILLSN